jgi:hypothetical protein
MRCGHGDPLRPEPDGQSVARRITMIFDTARESRVTTRALLPVRQRDVDRTGAFPVCPPLDVEDFTLDGLTVRNATAIGVRLIGVDGYRLTGTRDLDNVQYGPFPICSRDGMIDHNVASGHPEDAAIYVGDSEDAIIEHNEWWTASSASKWRTPSG